MKKRRKIEKLLCLTLALLTPAVAEAQPVSASVASVAPLTATPASQGQLIIDITTTTRHPAHLEAQSLKTPADVRIINSTVAPSNDRTCSRAAPSQSECWQIFRITLDTGKRCQASGNYEALFGVACWPGTAASLCKPTAYRFDFKLGAESTCNPVAKARSK